MINHWRTALRWRIPNWTKNQKAGLQSQPLEIFSFPTSSKTHRGNLFQQTHENIFFPLFCLPSFCFYWQWNYFQMGKITIIISAVVDVVWMENTKTSREMHKERRSHTHTHTFSGNLLGLRSTRFVTAIKIATTGTVSPFSVSVCACVCDSDISWIFQSYILYFVIIINTSRLSQMRSLNVLNRLK